MYNVLRFGTSHWQLTYYLCGTAIQSVLSVRDLGVIKILDFMNTLHLWSTKLTTFLGWLKEVLPVWTLTYWFIFINLWCDLYLSTKNNMGPLLPSGPKEGWGKFNANWSPVCVKVTTIQDLRLPSLNYQRQCGDMIHLYQYIKIMLLIFSYRSICSCHKIYCNLKAKIFRTTTVHVPQFSAYILRGCPTVQWQTYTCHGTIYTGAYLEGFQGFQKPQNFGVQYEQQ